MRIGGSSLTMARTRIKVKPFHHFMQLPPELRRRVFQLALTYGQPIRVHQRRRAPSRLHAATHLLMVSRQIHPEAVDVFYRKNVFYAATSNKGFHMLKASERG